MCLSNCRRIIRPENWQTGDEELIECVKIEHSNSRFFIANDGMLTDKNKYNIRENSYIEGSLLCKHCEKCLPKN